MLHRGTGRGQDSAGRSGGAGPECQVGRRAGSSPAANDGNPCRVHMGRGPLGIREATLAAWVCNIRVDAKHGTHELSRLNG